VGKSLKGRRDRFFVATKFGVVRDPANPLLRGVDGSPAYVRKTVDGSLRRLGIETIDLYYQHRVEPKTPIEETVGTVPSHRQREPGPRVNNNRRDYDEYCGQDD
jgi:aryl-alcohol dehydrogenase-like predicted oxidoreductase